MNKKILKTVTLVSICVFIFSIVPLSQAQTQDKSTTFILQKNLGDTQNFYLTVTVPNWLVDYYSLKNHNLNESSDYKKLVTPYALKPIADCLRQIYSNDQDLANGVLQITHQLTYKVTYPAEYPVETLAYRTGDCDLVSQIAASILQAADINVVLLLYQFPENINKNHMQIGVQLNEAPTIAQGQTFSVTYGGVKYYIGECTGSGWQVGECPVDYRDASLEVITLESSEQTGIGTVYASLEKKEQSTLDLTFSEKTVFTDSKITLAGQVNPALANQNITLLVKVSNSNWKEIGIVQTKSDGKFDYTWNLQNLGLYYVMASWSGNTQYLGTYSAAKNIVVLPDITYLVLGVIAFAGSVIAVFYLLLNYAKENKKAETKAFYPPPGAP
jgi:hypothetical protein